MTAGLAQFPDRVPTGEPGSGAYYERISGLAVHGGRHEQATPGAAWELPEEGIAVYTDTDRLPTPATGVFTAVYRLHPQGPSAVPTGMVFVRFAEGTKASSRQSAFEAAGYVIHEQLSWAPQAAWLKSATGRIADSLARIPDLQAIEGIKHIEPQMLQPAAKR